jgi:hypothetical protein
MPCIIATSNYRRRLKRIVAGIFVECVTLLDNVGLIDFLHLVIRIDIFDTDRNGCLGAVRFTHYCLCHFLRDLRFLLLGATGLKLYDDVWHRSILPFSIFEPSAGTESR